MKQPLTLYWARRDLRLLDNPALYAAVEYSKKEAIPFLPLFIVEDYMIQGEPEHQFGYPSRWVLQNALPHFSNQFKQFALVHGKAAKTILSLANEYALTLFVNEDVYSDFYTQIRKIREHGVSVKLYADALTISKDTKTMSGNTYTVFTPFKNAVWKEFCTAKTLPKPDLDSVTYAQLIPHLLEKIAIAPSEDESKKNLKNICSDSRTFKTGGKIYDINALIDRQPNLNEWYTNEEKALSHFDYFLKHYLAGYKDSRDELSNTGTSRMSLALAWGFVSARTLVKKIGEQYGERFSEIPLSESLAGATHYISELIWREFYKYLLFHNPTLMHTEFQEKFRHSIQWEKGDTAVHRFEKWIQGKTGYPIVDAAMMELATTGYMHNRARMIVSSVLTKNLGVDWRWGQEYFRAMLIDLDEASNNGGWQWGASVGADPKPIRIFNPYLQADSHDKEGHYQKKYLPHDYFEHPPAVVIEHKEARVEALKRYGLSSNEKPRDY